MRLNRNGFTLVELLIVIIILGVMVFLVAPSVTTGSDYARLKAASRGVVQLSRYARSMSLLRQMPIELIFRSDGTVRVQRGASQGEKLVSDEAFVRTNSLENAEAEEIDTPELRQSDTPESEGGSEYQMADLELEKQYEQITFRFEGYTDNIDEAHLGGRGLGEHSTARTGAVVDGDEDDVSEFRIQYRTNGTCRPYRVRIIAGEDELEFKVIQVNMLGVAKVLEEDEL
jgi:prepilin-type N-terminal cleavage/methylation domain-containing protein